MNKSVMQKLSYIDPPLYTQVQSYRKYLRKASNYSCIYCTITEMESSGASFQIDHYRPKSLFPQFETLCSNLRYSCARCNSYKSNQWIPTEEGCSHNCSKCSSQICKTNIRRFIDALAEDPSQMLYIGDDDKIYAYAGFLPADYTIDHLRLNRAQLIKLRHIRRFMDDWQEQLTRQLSIAQSHLESIKQQSIYFKNSLDSANFEGKQARTLSLLISKLYEHMELHASQSVLMIEQELSRLNTLTSLLRGADH